MHYRNGREAKNGDKIVQLGASLGGFGNAPIAAVGVLYDATPGNDYCNGNIAPIQAPHTTACLCDCLHVDDLAELLKEKGRASNRLSSCLRALVVHSPRRGA
jgi:hypothetical protein